MEHAHYVKRLATKGFTLVEIMIVVLIMGILLSIAVPSFVRAREHSRQRACQSNLRQFEQAKETFAFANRLPDGSTVTMADLIPTLVKGPIPACPSGGTYDVQSVGIRPTCTIAGFMPHVLD